MKLSSICGSSCSIQKSSVDSIACRTRNSGGGRSVFGFESDLEVESVGRENGGNYTCTVDNTFGSDRVTYVVMVQGGEGAYFFERVY